MDSKTKLLLNNNPLSYRSTLTIPKNISFGLEIELENIHKDKLYRLIKNNFSSDWQIKDDKSLSKESGAEIVTPPLYNKKETWILLKKLSLLIESLNPSFNNSSFQINFDGNLLPTTDDKIKLLKLFAYYEDIIYRFSKGEDQEYRESLETYAYPIILSLKSYQNIKNYILEPYTNQKRYGINFKTEPNLIEFRTPNSTSNPILWQNYITLFYYLISYSLSSKCKEDKLTEYIASFYKMYILEYYEHLHEEKAITLSKNIFPKIQDRALFLNQYIK